MTRQLFENLTEFFSPQPTKPRGMEEVGHIIGAELDQMKAEFTSQVWVANSEGMVGHFKCDGVWYTLECYPTPDEQKEEFGL